MSSSLALLGNVELTYTHLIFTEIISYHIISYESKEKVRKCRTEQLGPFWTKTRTYIELITTHWYQQYRGTRDNVIGPVTQSHVHCQPSSQPAARRHCQNCWSERKMQWRTFVYIKKENTKPMLLNVPRDPHERRERQRLRRLFAWVQRTCMLALCSIIGKNKFKRIDDRTTFSFVVIQAGRQDSIVSSKIKLKIKYR